MGRPKKNRQRRQARKVARRTGPRSVNITQRLWLTYNTVYTSTTGVALANGFTFTTATVYASYGNFANQVTNLYNEYRVESIQLRIVPVPGVSAAGLYPTGLYLAGFEGPTAPAANIAIIQRLPNHQLRPLFDKVITYKWRRTNDPENRTFTTTAAAAPILGGIVGYIGAGAPTLGTAYMTVEASFMITAKSRLV